MITKIVWDADLRGRQNSLIKVLGKPKPGETHCFVNRAQNKLAVLAGVEEEDSLGVLGYYVSPHGRLDLNAIQYISYAFSGRGFDMRPAIRKAIEARLERKRRRLSQ